MGDVGFSGGTEGSDKKPKKRKRAGRAELSVRDARYVKERKLGASMRKAALAAGYPASMANNAGNKIENKPAIASELERFVNLVDAAVPDWLIAQRLREGVDATQTKFATYEGVITDAREVIDYGERRQHIELAAELKGRAQKKGNTTFNTGGGPIVFKLTRIGKEISG